VLRSRLKRSKNGCEKSRIVETRRRRVRREESRRNKARVRSRYVWALEKRAESCLYRGSRAPLAQQGLRRVRLQLRPSRRLQHTQHGSQVSSLLRAQPDPACDGWCWEREEV
jgi:hypothetical protein